MASQKELVAVVSEQMGIPIETVTVIDRYLAEAGLRTRALRGRGHTPMTCRDAANLIVATAWEANPKDAVNLVTDFRSLPAQRVKETASIAADALGASFGDALANVIETAPAHVKEFSVEEDNPRHMGLEIIMRRDWQLSADIILTKNGKRHTFEYRPKFKRVSGSEAILRDLVRTAQFSQITIGFVGQAIAAELPKT